MGQGENDNMLIVRRFRATRGREKPTCRGGLPLVIYHKFEGVARFGVCVSF